LGNKQHQWDYVSSSRRIGNIKLIVNPIIRHIHKNYLHVYRQTV